jgi:NADH dehydrogenase/NADH:ubiquinone oxidoreductase subunit G
MNFQSLNGAGRPLVVAAMIVAMAFSSASASAESPEEMREKVQQYTLKLADLEKADVDKGAIQETKLTQLWLNEAQAQLVKEEEDEAARFLRRVDVSLQMLDKLIKQASAEKAANTRESAAIKMEGDARQSKINHEQAETKKNQLTKQLTDQATGAAKPK